GRLGLPVPKDILRGEPPLPAEDLTLAHHHRDAAALPAWALWSALGLAIGGVYVFAETDLGVAPAATGLAIFAGLAVIGFTVAQRRGAEQRSRVDPHTGQPRRPWAYGPMGRFLAGAFVI